MAGWLRDRKGRPGWHKIAPHVDGGTEQMVATIAIDGLPIEGVNLIALDVEGFELEALKGAERTLARDRPVVILEDLHRSKFKSFRRLGGMAYGHPAGALQRWLTERGYHEVETIKNDSVHAHQG